MLDLATENAIHERVIRLPLPDRAIMRACYVSATAHGATIDRAERCVWRKPICVRCVFAEDWSGVKRTYTKKWTGRLGAKCAAWQSGINRRRVCVERIDTSNLNAGESVAETKVCPVCGEWTKWKTGFVWHPDWVHYKAKFYTFDATRGRFSNNAEWLYSIVRRRAVTMEYRVVLQKV